MTADILQDRPLERYFDRAVDSLREYREVGEPLYVVDAGVEEVLHTPLLIFSEVGREEPEQYTVESEGIPDEDQLSVRLEPEMSSKVVDEWVRDELVFRPLPETFRQHYRNHHSIESGVGSSGEEVFTSDPEKFYHASDDMLEALESYLSG